MRSTRSSSNVVGSGDAGDDVGALGERAGLVEQHGVDRAHPFEGEPVLDEDPGLGRHRGRQGDHERDGKAEGVGAGDHQHGDGAGDRVVEVADRPPDDERDDRGGDSDVEQQGGEPVGEHLSSALAGLGVGDEPLDPGQGGVVADGVDTHPDRPVGRHRAGDHAVADRLG